MRIGIDARLLTQTGVGVYTYNLLNYLQDIVPSDWETYVYLRREDWDIFDFKNPKIVKRRADFRWHTFAEQVGFYSLLQKDKLDLMHFTYFSYPVFYTRPFVSTIHDLTPVLFKTGKASTKGLIEYYPKYFAMKRVIASAVKRAKAIITPTNTVKSQLEDMYGQKYHNKIYSIYEGVNEKTIKTKENINLKKVFNKPFFIYVGNFYPHKNVDTLVDAFSALPEEYRIVLVGPQDFFAKHLEEKIKSLRLSLRITFHFNPSIEDLVFFYKNSRALIHPSLSEGFGLTLVEASYFGTPIIASDIPVIHEILGDEYLSFNPQSSQDVTEKIKNFIAHKPTFKNKKLVEKYSFKKMVDETIEVYKKSIRYVV